jgi:hypothetical protein
MAESKSAPESCPGAPGWEDEFAANFIAQPPQLTQDQRIEIEERLTDQQDAIVRRLALESLTRSGAALEDLFRSDRAAAVGAASISENIMEYASRLRSLADMMQSASMRMDVALCAREDMVIVLEEAKAGQAVGHA